VSGISGVETEDTALDDTTMPEQTLPTTTRGEKEEKAQFHFMNNSREDSEKKRIPRRVKRGLSLGAAQAGTFKHELGPDLDTKPSRTWHVLWSASVAEYAMERSFRDLTRALLSLRADEPS
jgi:hypothetical protein